MRRQAGGCSRSLADRLPGSSRAAQRGDAPINTREIVLCSRHGRPIGATGAVLATRLVHSMRRDDLRRGVVTLCIDGGQGIALAIETIS